MTLKTTTLDNCIDLVFPFEEEVSDLRTLVVISLFTDAFVSQDEASLFGQDAGGGYWADPNFGSKIWLLTRNKINNETFVQIEDYASQALQWILDDGIASTIDVEVASVRNTINLIINFTIDNAKIQQVILDLS